MSVKYNFFIKIRNVLLFLVLCALLFLLGYGLNGLTGPSQGDYFVGFCTLGGASLVIVAAWIQAEGIKQQIIAEKEMVLRKENMEYLDWLERSYSGLPHRNMDGIRDISNLAYAYGKMESSEDLKTIELMIPDGIQFPSEKGYLYAKLPKEIKAAIKDVTASRHLLIYSLNFLKICMKLKERKLSISEETISDQAEKSIEQLVETVAKEHLLLPLFKEHLNFIREKIEAEGMAMPYNG